MTLSNYLKQQFVHFVDSYKKYFWRTVAAVLVFTVLCFVAIAFLFKFSDFDESTSKKQVSLLSYFFHRYSAKNIYSLVDLSKTAFIFFVSLFSIGLYRLTENKNEINEFSFASFMKKLQAKDILLLILVLITCAALDYGLFSVKGALENNFHNPEFKGWLVAILFMIRIYAPLILFSITLFKLISNKALQLNAKKLFFLFLSLWVFNEFAYEVSLFVRPTIFSLILIPFSEERKYLYESLLGTTLIAFYFVGYYSALTSLIWQTNEPETQSL